MRPLRERLTTLAGRWRYRPWVVLAAMVVVALVIVLGVRYGVAHPVAAVRPAPRSLLMPVKGAGELTVREQAEIAGKSSLRVKAVLVDAGHSVKRGQPLLLMDDEGELAAQLRAAAAAAQAARQGVDAARLAHRRAAVQHHRSASDADRALALAAQGPDAISASEVDASVAAAYTSHLDVEAGRVQANAARHTHVQALANLDVARERLRDATLRAPFDGLVISRQCSAGDTVSPGTPCLTVADPASLLVRARFDESALAAIRVGDSASVMLKSQPHLAIKARVERLNRSVDIDTREFTVDFGLAEVPSGWALGERATVEVAAHAPQVPLAIPLSCLVTSGTRRGVWVAHEGRARWRALRLGAQDGHQVEVLDGLQPEELVLLPRGIAPAMRVHVEIQPW